MSCDIKSTETCFSALSQELKTLGDHLRKKRLDLGLLQKEVGQKIGVAAASIYNWENNRSEPNFRYLPKIINFLGYALYSPPQSIGEKLSMIRKYYGLSQEKAAKMMGVDKSSIRDWEAGIHEPIRRSIKLIEKFLSNI